MSLSISTSVVDGTVGATTAVDPVSTLLSAAVILDPGATPVSALDGIPDAVAVLVVTEATVELKVLALGPA